MSWVFKVFLSLFSLATIYFLSIVFLDSGLIWFQNILNSFRSKYVARTELIMDELFMTYEAHRLIVLNAACTLVFFVLLLVLAGNVLAGVTGAIFGFALPQLVLKKIKRDRMKKFDQQLVRAAESMAGALKAGHSFLQALTLVAEEMAPPIKDEFKLFLKENRLGLSLDDSLRRMAGRVKSPDLEILVTAILVSRQTGANLAEILVEIAASLRDRYKLQGQVKALTAQARLSGLVVGLLPILMGIVIYLVDPDLIHPLFSTVIGKAVLGISVVMEFLGWLWIMRLLAVDF